MFYPSDQPPISQRMTMTHISNEELEAIKKRNADLQFCLDKEVARVMALTQQNAELKEQSSRLANESVRQAQQNADLCVKNAELLAAVRKSQSAAEKIRALLMMDGSLSAGKIRGHLATIQVECGLASEAIAKAGDKT